MWWTAHRILRSRSLATLAVLPIAIVPAFATWQGVSFVVWSGDVFMAAAVAAALAVWLRFHLKGAGASLKCVLIVGLLVGLATGSKQSGVLAVWAFAAYLVWASRGARRVLNPLTALLAAGAVVVITNPVFLLHPSQAPWEVGLNIIHRRAYVVERFIFSNGPCSVFELITSSFYWWPVLPMGALAVWACRREPWFPPVAFWSGFLSIGSAMGLIEMRMLQERYTAPLEMGIYFLFAVCGITVARRYNAEKSRCASRPCAGRSDTGKAYPWKRVHRRLYLSLTRRFGMRTSPRTSQWHAPRQPASQSAWGMAPLPQAASTSASASFWLSLCSARFSLPLSCRRA